MRPHQRENGPHLNPAPPGVLPFARAPGLREKQRGPLASILDLRIVAGVSGLAADSKRSHFRSAMPARVLLIRQYRPGSVTGDPAGPRLIATAFERR